MKVDWGDLPVVSTVSEQLDCIYAGDTVTTFAYLDPSYSGMYEFYLYLYIYFSYFYFGFIFYFSFFDIYFCSFKVT